MRWPASAGGSARGRAAGKKKARPWKPNERQIQRGAIDHIRIAFGGRVLAFHVPNGGRRGKIEAANLKRDGVLAGVADLVVMVRGGATLWIEMKTEDGGQSVEQLAFQAWCDANGHRYAVARSAAEAFEIVKGALA